MAAYNKTAYTSTKTLLQQDNDSWESLPKYEVDRKPAYASSTFSTASTVDVVPSGLGKLKSRLSSAKEARDRRVSLYEAWQRKLPTYYAKQTDPIIKSYPPHKAQFARQQRQQQHHSWYPHYKASSNDSSAEPDAEKVEDLKKERGHQSWYPHYKMPSTSSENSSAELDASDPEDLTEQTRHQSWYPHYKPSSASSNDCVDSSKVEDLKKEKRHQSWYPHYRSSSNDTVAKPDASKVQDLKKHTRHQSWYPHYKTSAGADVMASKVGGLMDRVVFRMNRITNCDIDEGLKAAYPTYTKIEC